jgi:glycosyltransferase involved in cell wall biosynthesis
VHQIFSRDEWHSSLSVAVIIPCFNEEKTIARVISDFNQHLSNAAIYVYDNNSTDGTIQQAREAGAIVRREARQGKGHVVRRMFSDVEADVYVLVDGDSTYDAAAAPRLIEALLNDNLDMVAARRLHSSQAAYRPGHVVGNKIFSKTVEFLFGKNFADMMSGYRVLSRRFVKSFPLISNGFEIETEMTIHALTLSIPSRELDTVYEERPVGSFSKLNTFRDGAEILWSILILLKNERPFFLFCSVSAFSVLVSILLGLPLIETFLRTGLVERLPTAVLAASLMVIAVITMGLGFSLDSLSRFRAETKRLHYLSYPSVRAHFGERVN